MRRAFMRKTFAGKKKAILTVSALLAAGMLTGCADTPKESLVKMKGAKSEKNYEETSAEKTSSIGETVGAPKTFQSEIRDETGILTISTDAKVEIPNAEKASAILVKQHPFDQEILDKATEVFFPDAKIYSSSSYFRRTKEVVQKELNKWKGYLAEGNLDPNGWGKDENGNYNFDIYQTIEDLEAEYEKAPESRELAEVKPMFGLEHIDYEGNGDAWVNKDGFSGVAETPDGRYYQYYCQRGYGYIPFQIGINDLTMEKSTEESMDTDMYLRWMEYSLFDPQNNNFDDFPDEDNLKKQEKLTFDEAKALADEKVKALEIPYMELAAWDYGLYMGEAPGKGRDSIYDVGYILHYSRNIENIPITYTTESGGEPEDLNGDMETWGYEDLMFCIGSDGISEVKFNNFYDIGETKTEHVSLKSFDEIMKIYEKMMLIQNTRWLENNRKARYHINRITFGYTRIYEPATDSKTGILVPAWDFFGSFTSEGENGETYTDNSKAQSFLTVNAIDGSIIDRAVGY